MYFEIYFMRPVSVTLVPEQPDLYVTFRKICKGCRSLYYAFFLLKTETKKQETNNKNQNAI